MNKPVATATPAIQEVGKSAPEAQAAAPAGLKPRHKPVEYKVRLAAAEHAQLIALRDSCRAAGISASKRTLLRAAVTILNQQSSFKIEAQLQQLPTLKSGHKKTPRE